ncbi:MAG: DNA-binding protein [Desulfitobacteriaceae bacterium]
MQINIQSREDLKRFLAEEIINTSEAIRLLGCSRQNLHEQVLKGHIQPIKMLQKDKLFLKSDIIARIKGTADK